MIYILGTLAGLSSIFLVLNRYFEGMSVFCWMATFLSCATLCSVLFVWGVTRAESSSDYRYMELWLEANDPQKCTTDIRFMELYIRYDREYNSWLGRQFACEPPEAIRELFSKGHKVAFQTTMSD